jgi:hypothetical protein
MRYTLELRLDGSLALYLSASEAKKLLAGNNKRVILAFGEHTLHCAILRDPVHGHYLRLAKAHHKKWGISAGSSIDASIQIDQSTYQFDLPETIEEVLRHDADAASKWQMLSPGKQRSIIYQIGKIKAIDLQIQKSLLLAERLKSGHSNPMTILKTQQ